MKKVHQLTQHTPHLSVFNPQFYRNIINHMYPEQRLAWAALALTGLFLGSKFVINNFELFQRLALKCWKICKWDFKKPPAIQIGKLKISDVSRLRHTHIVGATGSGKTVLLEHLITQDIERGHGLLIIDAKGDRELFDRVKEVCRQSNRETDLKLLSATFSSESVSWNPCGLGRSHELQNKFYNSMIFSEQHYAKHSERALLESFQRLEKTSPLGFSLEHLVRELEKQCELQNDKNLEGVTLDLFNLENSEWREVLVNPERSKEEVSLLDLISDNKILFVDLPTESKAVQSQRIGRLLLQELSIISGLRKSYPELKGHKPFSVYVDEFDMFATEAFATFLNKGRSSGFMIHLSHQTLSDLKKVSDTFAGQVMGNTNVRFIFRQDDPDDAEIWSRFFGTKSAIKSTWRETQGFKTGDTSNREVTEFRMPPDTIKSLQVGRCVLSIKDQGLVREIRIPFELNGGSRPFSNFSLKLSQYLAPLDRTKARVRAFIGMHVLRSYKRSFSYFVLKLSPCLAPLDRTKTRVSAFLGRQKIALARFTPKKRNIVEEVKVPSQFIRSQMMRAIGTRPVPRALEKPSAADVAKNKKKKNKKQEKKPDEQPNTNQ